MTSGGRFTNPFQQAAGSSSHDDHSIDARLTNIEKQMRLTNSTLASIQDSIRELMVEFQSFKQVAVIPAADSVDHGPGTASAHVYDDFLMKK